MAIYGNYLIGTNHQNFVNENCETVFENELASFNKIMESFDILDEGFVLEAKVDFSKIKSKIKDLWIKFKTWAKDIWDKIVEKIKSFAKKPKKYKSQADDTGEYEYYEDNRGEAPQSKQTHKFNIYVCNTSEVDKIIPWRNKLDFAMHRMEWSGNRYSVTYEMDMNKIESAAEANDKLLEKCKSKLEDTNDVHSKMYKAIKCNSIDERDEKISDLADDADIILKNILSVRKQFEKDVNDWGTLLDKMSNEEVIFDANQGLIFKIVRQDLKYFKEALEITNRIYNNIASHNLTVEAI